MKKQGESLKNRLKELLTLCCLLVPFEAIAQNSSDDYTNTSLQLPNYVPQSPEVAAFKLYGDIPVSEYTGTPDISIPLYTLRQGSIEVPVVLAYHPDGIKVAQEASWVGLGWSLMAGGVISVAPVGNMDATSITGGYDLEAWNGFTKMVQHWKIGTNQWTPDDSRYGSEDPNMWYCDDSSVTPREAIFEGLIGAGERDVYCVSLPNGKNFKFILHPKDNTPVLVGKSVNAKVDYQAGYFTVLDKDGTSYIFDKVEENSPQPLNYRLTSIRNKEGGIINFTYTLVYEVPIPNIIDSYSFDCPARSPFVPARSISGNTTPFYVHYLSAIETDTEKLVFTLASREDRYPGTSGRLSSVKLVSKLTTNEISHYDFNQNYFVGTNVGGDHLSGDENNGMEEKVISADVRKKRMKLLSVTKNDVNGNTDETYTFTYNEDKPLPYKTSFACDYWGYYNGAGNVSTLINGHQHTLLPELDSRYNNSFGFSSSRKYPSAAAIRNCSAGCITTGMLKSIKYPTGGCVEFEFEPHSFRNYKIVPKEDIDRYNSTQTSVNTINNNNLEFSEPAKVFNIPYTQEVTFSVTVNFPDYTASQVSGSGSTLRRTGPGSVVIRQFSVSSTDGPSTSFNKSETFILEAGNYVLSSGLSSVIPDQHYSAARASSAQLTYHTSNPGNFESSVSIGGGVRIKKITRKDYNGSISGTVVYKYEDIAGKTSGLLLTPLMMTKSRVAWIFSGGPSIWDGPVYQYTPFSVASSFLSVHPAYDDIPVGYDRVTVEATGAFDTGKTVMEFDNTSHNYNCEDFTYTGKYIPAPNIGGSLLKTQIYDSANTLLVEENNSYEITDLQKEILNIHVEDTYYGKGIYDCASRWPDRDTLEYISRFYIALYPTTRYRIDLKRHTSTSYFNSTPVTMTTDYIYDSFHRPSKITKSSGRTTLPAIEEFTYASSSDLNSYNILSLVKSYKKTIGTSTVALSHEYGGWQQKFCRLSTSRTVPGNSDVSTVTYKYDPKWNPAEVNNQGFLPDVYLWGYRYSRVIARISNITYSEVEARMGSSLQILCASDIPDATALENLQSLFPESVVTTWLYNPSVGMKQQITPWRIPNFYQWDAAGRLHLIQDAEGLRTYTRKTIKVFDYHYKDQ